MTPKPIQPLSQTPAERRLSESTRAALEALREASGPGKVSPQLVQELQIAARELSALSDVLSVTALSQITFDRFSAWQTEAGQLLQTSAA